MDISTLPVPEESSVKGSIGLSVQAKHAIELAVEEAKSFKHLHVGLEHILLGLICEEQSLSAPLLRLLIESYIFRRLICGIPTHGLNKVFATLAKEIDKEHYLESVQAKFLQRSAGSRFPRDEEFRAAFVVKDIYNFRNRHYLLSKLENHRRKEHANIDDYTIEHILPQNPQLSIEWQKELGPNWQKVQAKYLHTIGNLTLAAPEYNSSMSDRLFHEKRDMEFGFAQSPLQLNAGLRQLKYWNTETIEKRAQDLADITTQIWSIPVLSVEQLGKYGKWAQRASLVEVIGPVEHPLAGFVPSGAAIKSSTVTSHGGQKNA